MSDSAPDNRDLLFLRATLEGNLFPRWEKDDVLGLRRMMTEDLTRKAAISSVHLGEQQTTNSGGGAEVTMDDIGIHVDYQPANGRFIVLSAAQELNSVLETVSSLGMSYLEVALPNLQVGHRILWRNGETVTPIFLCVASAQRVDALTFLISTIVTLFSPKSILLAGMMGGIPTKIGFLDVVVPTSIYDGRIIGTKENKQLVLEPESFPAHPAVHAILNNVPEFRCGDTSINVKKNKKSLTVAAKFDDISHELFATASEVDRENIVAFEMEGQAVVTANHFQQLAGQNVILGMAKGVADFGGLASGQSDTELEAVRRQIGYSLADGDFDPIRNKKVKAKLQLEATRRAFVVAAEISRRVR